MKAIFKRTTERIIQDKVYVLFTEGETYVARRIFEQWPWMIMAWDNEGVGRYIHGKDYGEYRLI